MGLGKENYRNPHITPIDCNTLPFVSILPYGKELGLKRGLRITKTYEETRGFYMKRSITIFISLARNWYMYFLGVLVIPRLSSSFFVAFFKVALFYMAILRGTARYGNL